jgi:xanthine dehydrogenase YagS FAD-binding subunit
MKNFKHFNASTLENAVSLLHEYGSGARVITGGVDLVSLMKNRVIEPKALINIKTIPGLNYISEDDNTLRIGALTPISAIEFSSLIADRYSILSEAAHLVASPLQRNMSSLSGNLCQSNRCWYYRRGPDTGLTFFCRLKGGNRCYAADGDNRYHAVINAGKCCAVCPSDMATALVAMEASARIVGTAGEKTIALEQIYSSLPLGRLLQPDEIITEIIVPKPRENARQRFLKFAIRKTIDFAIVSVAAVSNIDGNTIYDTHIVLGGVAPAPFRATLAEDMLRAKPITQELVDKASLAAVSRAKPLSNNAYKLPILHALLKRAIMK